MSTLIVLSLLSAAASARKPRCEDAIEKLTQSDHTTVEEPVDHATFVASTARPDTMGIKLEMLVKRGDQPILAMPLTSPVCNGDFVAFRVVPTVEQHVSVLACGTSGTWTILHPAEGPPVTMMPDAPLRLPEREPGYPVSGDSGNEYLVFFLSNGPYSAQLQQLLDLSLVKRRRLAGEDVPWRTVDLVNAHGGPASYVVGGLEQIIVLKVDHRDRCD